MPEQIDFRFSYKIKQSLAVEVDFQLLLNPGANGPKENSQEFSQVGRAAYQQGIDLVTCLAWHGRAAMMKRQTKRTTSCWRIEDIIGGDKRLNFSKPFMRVAGES